MNYRSQHTIGELARLFIWVAVLCMYPSCLLAQKANEYGMAPIKVYASDEYKNHDENFAVAQDRRGVLYFGNFGGILEFDGINWRTIKTTNQTKVSALLCSKSGTLFVGARDEFGYLAPSKTGELIFKSLSEPVKQEIGEISQIIEASTGTICFISGKGIFELRQNKITGNSKAISASPLISNQKNKAVYIENGKLTILDLVNNKSTVVNTNLKDIIGIVDSTVVFTKNNGLYAIANNSLSPLENEAGTYLKNSDVTYALRYDKNTIICWSSKKGLIYLSNGGNVLKVNNYTESITESRVNSIYKDKDANLWLALDNGIATINTTSPITEFSSRLGSITDITRYQGKIFVASNKGLFRLNESSAEEISGISTGCWALLAVNNILLTATSNGVYVLNGTNQSPVRVSKDYSFSLIKDETDSRRVYVGHREGLGELFFTNATPTYKLLRNLDDNIVELATAGATSLWAGSISKGLFLYNPATDSVNNFRYTSSKGELSRVGNRLLTIDGQLIVYNAKGLHQFNSVIRNFEPSAFLSPTRSPNKNWYGLIAKASAKDSYWATSGDNKNLAYYYKQDNAFKKDSARFLLIADRIIRSAFSETNTTVWLGGPDGLIRFDNSRQNSNVKNFQTLIRRISVGDSVLFDGFSNSNAEINNTLAPGSQKLKAKLNDIKFDFTANDYVSDDKLFFQFYLDGFDDDWGPLTKQTSKEYTNLSPGDYTFHVRAKNAYSVDSQESTYNFSIPVPIYQRWWAVLVYIVTASAAIFFGVRWRLNQSDRERKQLEKLIKERTEEIVEQKQELEKQSEELASQNDQLEKIDLIVQSINSEVDFSNLFQTILAKFSVIRNMDNGAFLALDTKTNTYKFRAVRGIQDLAVFTDIELTPEQAESRYIDGAEEVQEDIFYKNDFTFVPLNNPIDNLSTSKSLLTIVIKNENQTEGFIVLENISRSYAFDQRDISMIKNLKEHLRAAYIKTRLLENLENTLTNLRNAQDELIRQEKLASVGQLTKGIVDRILNPLNYVNNFSQSSDFLIKEIIDVLDEQKETLPTEVSEDLTEELVMLKNNQNKILEHSNSTTRILKDMQKLLREKSREYLETDINSFIESKVRKAFQDIKVHYTDCPIELSVNLDKKNIRAKILPYELGETIHSLMSNSYYTLYEKLKVTNGFSPEIRISTSFSGNQVIIRFRDNGKGIPNQELEKIFSPFFTTKPTSKGTGLGLFMVKDIIETHRGKVEINSREGEFTEISLIIPALLN